MVRLRKDNYLVGVHAERITDWSDDGVRPKAIYGDGAVDWSCDIYFTFWDETSPDLRFYLGPSTPIPDVSFWKRNLVLFHAQSLYLVDLESRNVTNLSREHYWIYGVIDRGNILVVIDEVSATAMNESGVVWERHFGETVQDFVIEPDRVTVSLDNGKEVELKL